MLFYVMIDFLFIKKNVTKGIKEEYASGVYVTLNIISSSRTKMRFQYLFISVAIVAAWTASSAIGEKQKRPNIVFILTDDNGWRGREP